MKNISKSAFLSLHIAFPSKSEQTAIATILSDMDAELAALESVLTTDLRCSATRNSP